jgi:hypothetical protein
MKLDADKLRAEAEAHRDRMESPLWSRDDGKPDEHWTAPLQTNTRTAEQPSSRAVPNESPPQSQPTRRALHPSTSEREPLARPMPRESITDGAAMELLPRLEAFNDAVEKLTAAMNRRLVGGGGVPGWLETAAGDPHSYDAPDSERTGVCVRVLPTTYAQLQQTQRKMGLRTIAGAWEFLLRLGLAAAERLPA